MFYITVASLSVLLFNFSLLIFYSFFKFNFLLRPTRFTTEMSVNATSNYLQDYIYYTAGTIMFTTITTLRIILLLPLCTFVLYLGHQQWKQQRSFTTASHADIFTYHMAAMELIFVMGVFLSFGGTCTNQSVIAAVGSIASLIPYFGEILFHVVTCVEHYLAVVHPIIYMGLRTPRGVRIRNKYHWLRLASVLWTDRCLCSINP